MQIQKSHRILAALLALVMVVGMLPATAFARSVGDDGSAEMNEAYANQESLKPIGPSFNVDTLLEWSPESDPDAAYSRASIPMTDRKGGFVVNPLANPDAKLQLWSTVSSKHDGDSSQGNENFFSYAFNYWQYTDTFVYWAGSEEGFIVCPTGEYIDAAHTNGVPVLATLGFPWGSGAGYVQQVRDFLQKDADGTFPVADKMIAVMDYYGFDGYAFNQESYGCSAEDGANMDAFMRYLHTKCPDMVIAWYDSMLPSGGVSYQDAVTNANKGWMQDSADGTRAVDEFLMNYNWNDNKVRTTIDTMTSIGRSQFDAFAGFNVQRNVYGDDLRDYQLIDEDGIAKLSLGLYYANQTITLAKDGEDFHETERSYYVNAAGDPRVNNVDVANPNVREWAGMSRFFADKSPVTAAPFVTNFNTGHGRNLFVDGELSRNGDWSYQSIQDVLPTWTWIIDSEGEKLQGGYDFADAWNGGSSVKFFGDLTANMANDIMLYSTNVAVEDGMKLGLTCKGDQGKMKLVAYYGDSATESYADCEQVAYDLTAGSGWTTTEVDLSAKAGKTLYAIGLKIESDTDLSGYQVNLGRLSILCGEADIPVAPQGAALEEMRYTDGYHAEARILWDAVEGASSYEIYKVNGETRTLIMETPNTAYYIGNLVREAGEREITLEIVPVNCDGVRGEAARLVFGWLYADGDTEIVTPDNSVNVCLNATVSGYSMQGDGAECDKALDGTCENASKWWANGAGDWMSIDLGRECAIKRWVIMHGGAGGEGEGMNHRSISLYYKDAAGQWVEADRFDNNKADITDILLEEPITAREWKIRVNAIGSSPWGAVNIYEWQMFETGYPQTDAIPMNRVSAVNGPGASDSVTLSGVPAGHTVKIYKPVQDGFEEIGSLVSAGGMVTLSGLDFGTEDGGKISYTTTAPNYLESARLCAFFDSETAEKSEIAEDVSFVQFSQPGSATSGSGEDAYTTLTVEGLNPGDVVYVYENGAEKRFTRMSLPVAADETVVSINRIRVPLLGGSLSLQVKRAGMLISDLYSVETPIYDDSARDSYREALRAHYDALLDAEWYTQNGAGKLAEALEQGLILIDTADNFRSALAEALVAGKALLEDVPNMEEEMEDILDQANQAALNAAKYYAHVELTHLDLSGLTAEEKVLAQEIIGAAREAVDAAETVEEVEEILAAAREAVANTVSWRCAAEEFTDVTVEDWFHEDLDDMLNSGYMNGYPDNTFRPLREITRGELVTILYRMAGEPEVTGDSGFRDVADDYYTSAVIWASENAITNGYPDGTFRPAGKISRQELVTFLYRFAQAKPVGENHLKQFPDAGDVAGYAVNPMNWAVANGIVGGAVVDGVTVLAPEANALREQVAAILSRFLNSK